MLRESLAPRYDVEREIGVGGMARVYLAVERHPNRRVAVKVLDPELSTRLLRERFIREVEVASKLTHPHIVPIFAAGEAGGLFYYIMPYIEGESLRHRLRRERRLAVESALHIVLDVAEALAYAHSQGIIHRDIKPENILLSSDHAVVADFGIARAISAAGNVSLTQTGQSIGSPGYMSPEQALGLPADARSDVYSLGCVLFETLAGETAIGALNERRIHNWTALDSNPTLRAAPAGMVRAIKHAVSTALAPLPEQRFPAVDEFVEALGGSVHRVSTPTRGVFAGSRGRRRIVVGLGLALLAVTTAGVFLRRPAHALNERRVAVAVIENRTGDPALDNLGYMAADWVTQGLAQTGLVEVVPSISVMGNMPGHDQADRRGIDVIRALGRSTGAGTIVSGGYYRSGDSVQFQVQISAAGDGKVLRALPPITAPLSQPLSAVETLRQRVMTALATLFDSRLNRWAATATQPPNFQAYQEFIAGLDRFAEFDPHGAIAHFERSAAVDTTFKLPLVFAANLYMNIGEFAVAESLGKLVERRSDHLAPLDRAYLGWVLATCRGDPTVAYQSSRQMMELAPGSDAVYLFVERAMAMNRPREAVNALLTIDADRGFLHGWWIYWESLAQALHMLGDYREELKQGREAMRRFPDNLQVLTFNVRALAALGRTAEIRSLLTKSANLEMQMDWTSGDAMLVAADELRAHGWRAAADSVLALSEAWVAAHPADSSTASRRYLRAVIAFSAGRLDEARDAFEQLARGSSPRIEQHGWLNGPPERLDYIGYLGAVAGLQQRRDDALKEDRALAAMTQRYLYGRHTMWRARIHAVLGERENAINLIREALRQGYPHMHSLHEDVTLESLRDYPPFQELLKPKG